MTGYPIVGHFPSPEGADDWYTLVGINEDKYRWEPIDSSAVTPAALIPEIIELLSLQGITCHVLYHRSEGVH